MEKILQKIVKFFDKNFVGVGEVRLERLIVLLAILTFISHVLLVLGHLYLGLFPGSFLQNQNLFSTIPTPLTLILFYEVLHLVLSLPKSIILSIKIQFQIASLILIREVFKSLEQIQEIDTLYKNSELLRQVSIYLVGSIICFFLVALFSNLTKKAIKYDKESGHPLYISIKKVVSVVLVGILVALAAVNVLGTIPDFVNVFPSFEYLEVFFYVIIFVDILLFLVSMYFIDDYGIVFLDSAFVISTLFIRLALASKGVFKVGVIVASMISSLTVLYIYHYLWNKNDEESSNIKDIL